MKNSTRRTTLLLLALLAGLVFASFADAQTPNADPFSGRIRSREARLAYLANQRAKASVPVNYSFPVRSDAATVYSARAYAPQYHYSRSPNALPPGRQYDPYLYGANLGGSPSMTYRPVAPPYAYPSGATPTTTGPYTYPQNGTYPPYANMLHTDGRPCPVATPQPAVTSPTQPNVLMPANQATNAYYATGAPYSPTVTTQMQADPNYFVGKTAAGPPRVYPKDEPLRNVFRYLFP